MKLIDSHAHLQFKAYDPDREEVIKRNLQELAAIINVGADLDSSRKAVELTKQYDGLYAAIGIHPHHTNQWDGTTFSTLETLANNEKVVAVGEIGLDNHEYIGYPKPDLNAQSKILHQQIELAIKLKLATVFHCRDAYDELYEQVKKYEGKITGVVHCFMGNMEQAARFLDLGLEISFTGNITYKNNSYIRDVAAQVPEDRILIETDAPYLPPEDIRGEPASPAWTRGRPHRGERNEPRYVKIVAEKIAEIRDLSFEEMSLSFVSNTKKIFKL
ncbi:MAG: hypothetical protein A2Y57_02575 [Candidatus Woykebacteria bacterium RBG_13_40_7b]|uniref:Hydrolase TatD n=1 Tax=Candidatus Woykebacteria bacterium RBG_13_40_7b TaxID=1802594 RepID=A0A1G1WBF6_9BACT|nr:MAG: hypothetical protein A2Y57_02575 [Candidatus Woykebacteria bacterium RBG_13_40_7b]